MAVVRPALMIHGGTGAQATAVRERAIRKSLRRIAADAFDFAATHTALETAVRAVQQLEDDPLFNAGTGSALQEDGAARMSASVMDGIAGRFAGAINIERVRNPVLVARALLDQHDRILEGVHATLFARSLGFSDWDPVTPERLQRWTKRREQQRGTLGRRAGGRSADRHGTVGAVVVDRDGALAAATSTGGRGFERPGRVSDSATPAGNFATMDIAISCTGTGEDIIDEALAARLAQCVGDGRTLSQSFQITFRELRARKREAGAIAVDRRGMLRWDTTLPALFAVGHADAKRVESF